jgi:hypothetical protein
MSAAGAELRAALEGLSILKLLKRATKLGVPEAVTDAVEESKEDMVELLVAWAGDDTPSAAAAREAAELRADLDGLSIRKLLQKAEDLGIPEAQIEAAEESDTPKEALLALLLSPRSPGAPGLCASGSAAAELRAELEGLSIRKLLQRATKLGVPEADTDAVEESKEDMVELLVAWVGDDDPPAAAAAMPLSTWLEEVRGSIRPSFCLQYTHRQAPTSPAVP